MATSPQKFSLRKQINSNKVKFTVKLFLLNIAPRFIDNCDARHNCFTHIILPTESPETMKNNSMCKASNTSLADGFPAGKDGKDICSFPWGGQAVTVLKRLKAEEVEELVCFKKRQNQKALSPFTSVEQLDLSCASPRHLIRFFVLCKPSKGLEISAVRQE